MIQLLICSSDWIMNAALSLKNHEQLEAVAYFAAFNFFFFFLLLSATFLQAA